VFEDPVISGLDVLALRPHPHVTFPVGGVETVRNFRAPLLNEHGPAVWKQGWAAVTEGSENTLRAKGDS